MRLFLLGRGMDGGNWTYVIAWLASLLFHGIVMMGTAMLYQHLRLSPQPEPFRWQVAVVESRPAALPATEPVSPTFPPAIAPVSSQEEPVGTQPRPRASRPVKSPAPGPPRPLVPEVPPLAPRQESDVIERTPPASREEQPRLAEPVNQAEPPLFRPRLVEPSGALPSSEPTVAVPSVPPPDDMTEKRPQESPPPAQPTEPALPLPAPEATRGPPPPTVEPSSESLDHLSRLMPVPAPEAMSGQAPPQRADYGWLASVLHERIQALRRYPAEARRQHWEGRVVVRAVVQEDGEVVDVQVVQSSGYSVLDEDALNVLRRVSPLRLTQSLGRPRVAIHLPIRYQLQR